jgi:hypothetical protein
MVNSVRMPGRQASQTEGPQQARAAANAGRSKRGSGADEGVRPTQKGFSLRVARCKLISAKKFRSRRSISILSCESVGVV